MRDQDGDSFRTAAYWRGRAEEARTIADDMTTADAKVTLEDIALKFEWMARQADVRERVEDGKAPPISD